MRFRNLMGYPMIADESRFRHDLDCAHMIPAHFENGENVTDGPPAHTKAAHFKNGRF